MRRFKASRLIQRQRNAVVPLWLNWSIVRTMTVIIVRSFVVKPPDVPYRISGSLLVLNCVRANEEVEQGELRRPLCYSTRVERECYVCAA